MSTTAVSQNSFSWQNLLGQTRDFPCISSTHAALNLPKLRGALEGRVVEEAALQAEPIATTIGNAFALNTIASTVAMTVISYVALRALSILSLYVNGAIGVGKVTLSLVTALTDRKAAQNLFEEGVFHMLVAATDFAVASFGLIRAAIAIGYGLAPRKTNEYFELLYKPWDGAIQHEGVQTPEQMRIDRKDYSYLQATADAVQCLVMPDEGVGRIQSALAALKGEKA